MAILLQLRAFLPDRYRAGWLGTLSSLHASKFAALFVRPVPYYQLRIQHAAPNKEFHTHSRRSATTFMSRMLAGDLSRSARAHLRWTWLIPDHCARLLSN